MELHIPTGGNQIRRHEYLINSAIWGAHAYTINKSGYYEYGEDSNLLLCLNPISGYEGTKERAITH